MLLTVGRYYEDDLRERADGLTALWGRRMLILMFVVVGFVIAGVMLPEVAKSYQYGRYVTIVFFIRKDRI